MSLKYMNMDGITTGLTHFFTVLSNQALKVSPFLVNQAAEIKHLKA